MRTVIRGAVALLVCLALAACGDDPDAKIAADHEAAARNSQAYARTLFDGLCARRNLSELRCTCMRTRLLDQGARAVAFIGASYGGDLEAAGEASAELDEAQRAAAIEAYFTADAACMAEEERAASLTRVPDGPAPPAATLDDVRDSCQPSMQAICVCRAEALRDAIGDGAIAAAVAINSGDEAQLQALARGREDGWLDAVVSAYARTSAPCIVRGTR